MKGSSGSAQGVVSEVLNGSARSLKGDHLAEGVEKQQLRLPVLVKVCVHVDREERADGDVEAKAVERRAPVDGEVGAQDDEEEEDDERPRDDGVDVVNHELDGDAEDEAREADGPVEVPVKCEGGERQL